MLNCANGAQFRDRPFRAKEDPSPRRGLENNGLPQTRTLSTGAVPFPRGTCGAVLGGGGHVLPFRPQSWHLIHSLGLASVYWPLPNSHQPPCPSQVGNLTLCRACGGEGGGLDGAPCARCAETGIEAAKLEVVQTLQRVGGELRFVPPKTDDSMRTVPLPDLCVTALCEHRVNQDRERTDAWPRWQDHGLVFPSHLGTPMEPDNLRRSWGRIRAAAGLGAMRLHDRRHTCLAAAGVRRPAARRPENRRAQ